MNINFNTKQEYLEFVAEWKALYKELSFLIRKCKTYTKNKDHFHSRAAYKKPEITSELLDNMFKEINTEYNKIAVLEIPGYHKIVLNIYGDAKWAAVILGNVATHLLKLRKEGKLRSAEQRQMIKIVDTITVSV